MNPHENGSAIKVVHDCACWLELTENWIYNHIQRLPETCDSVVLCKRSANRHLFPGTQVHCPAEDGLVKNAGRVVGQSIRRGRLLRRSHAAMSELADTDGSVVVHSHFGPQAWLTAPVASSFELPQVASFYGFDATYLPAEDEGWRERYETLFEHVRAVIAEGPHMAGTIEALGCPKEKIHVVHLGVPARDIPFAPRVWKGDGPLRILMAASFREKKGIPNGIRGAGDLARRLPVEVTLVGDAGDPVEKKRILEAIENAGLTDRVHIPGFMSFADLMKEAARCHLYLAPSVIAANGDSEGGLPYTLPVMAASGLGCVASRHCDVPELVVHGETGMLADEHDVQGLVSGVEQLVDDPALWETVVHNARARVEAEFDLDAQAKEWAGVYGHACNGATAG